LQVRLNGQIVARLILDKPATAEYAIALSRDFLANENDLTFELPDAESPMRLGISEDSRRLGISVEWLEID